MLQACNVDAKHQVDWWRRNRDILVLPRFCFGPMLTHPLPAPLKEKQTVVEHMFGVVQSLSSWTPRKDLTCSFFQFDTLEDSLRVVQVDTLESVAYVLPTIKDGGDQMEESLDGGKTFYVIPPRSSWSSIGWDSPLLNQAKRFLGIDLREDISEVGLPV